MTQFMRLCEIIYGLYWIWIALNSFFKWQALPPQSDKMLKLLESLDNARIILPTVKILELLIGLLFIFDFHSIIGLLLMAPLLFGIIAIQIFINNGSWVLVSSLLFPFLILVFKHANNLQTLFSLH
jgi:hypothetical protein